MTTTLAEVESAARLSLRPGDRLVLSFPQRLSEQEFDSVRDLITETWDLPDGVGVIILDSGATLQVVAREDGS
jgi:hypothetical protein